VRRVRGPQDGLRDLGIDFLDLTEIAARVEEGFAARITAEDIDSLHTVGTS
jgi:acyl carrier protein